MADETMHDRIEDAFLRYDPVYLQHRAEHAVRLEKAAEALARAARNGSPLHCSQQMYLEARWMERYTAHWDELDNKLRRIELSLSDKDQHFANEQNPSNGTWGPCYDNEVMRLGETVVELERLASRGEAPVYPLRLTRSTGSSLLQRLQALLVSDIENTGINHRGELSNLITSLSQATFKPYLREMLPAILELGPNTRPGTMEEVFRFFLAGAQDPITGYWGAWYLMDDRIVKTADLSMTFHIIKYSKGNVQYWPQIIATTIAGRDKRYPYGWRSVNGWNNHNLYDVAAIFRYGWPMMDEEQRVEAAAMIEDMLDWSLTNTVLSAGSIHHDPTQSDSLADAYYFAISFLDLVGYWNQEKLFWAAELPPHLRGRADCLAMHSAILNLDPGGWAGDGAREKIARNCPIE